MNRNTAIILIVVIVAGVYLAGPTVIDVVGDVYDAFFPTEEMSTLVQFHDKDGDLIDVPMAITAGGVEVATMTVTASWTVEGTNIAAGTFNMNGVIKIGIFDNNLLKIVALSQHVFDSSEYISSVSHTWTLDVLLQNRMSADEKELGWALEIKAVFTPTATDVEGNAVAPGSSTTSPISASLAWDSQAGALNIIQMDVAKTYA